MGQARNTTTERRCPTCQGAGELTVPHYTGDPQLETEELCPNEGCVAGWIRWAPVDPLVSMGHVRAWGRGHPIYRKFHDKAMAPVSLPVWPRPAPPTLRQIIAAPRLDLVAYANGLLRGAA